MKTAKAIFFCRVSYLDPHPTLALPGEHHGRETHFLQDPVIRRRSSERATSTASSFSFKRSPVLAPGSNLANDLSDVGR
jgi:hypothetical protein